MINRLWIALAVLALWPFMTAGAAARVVWFGVELGWLWSTGQLDSRVAHVLAMNEPTPGGELHDGAAPPKALVHAAARGGAL